MRSALADATADKAGRPRWWVAGLSAFLAVVVAATLWVVLRDEEYVAPPPDGQTTAVQPARAAAALQDLADAVRSDDVEAAAGLAPDGDDAARGALRALVANAGAIPIEDFSLRYLDELGAPGNGEWRAAVDLTWAFAGFDHVESSAEIEVTFAGGDGGVGIAALGGEHGLRPIWLADPVQVRRGPGTLVVAADKAGSWDRMARRAVVVVRRVVTDWRTGLVVEVPGTKRALDAALGAEPGTFANVAGLTARPDGTNAGQSPAHVFLNPERQATLRRKGAQIVLSHEAAHVALDATDSSLPVWLTEGFADYIALRDVGLPLATTASQVIDQVRRDGAPDALPDDSDFDDDSDRFGASYEAAWLACRLLAQRAGEKTLLGFYHRADGATDFDRLFQETFGITVRQFTRHWRRSLTDLAA